MATLLAFILTDANITQRALNRALSFCVDNSFNCITVDGCMSTNDSVIMLANGAARNYLIDQSRYFDLFIRGLNVVCLELAKMIVKDAEGASKFIKIKVEKAKNFAEAKQVALSIANSSLFKTAMYGENPNFGRIVASIGASGIEVKEKNLKIKVSPLNKKDINVDVSINRGKSSAIVYTSDLTPEYIKINAEYN
jgi:glutamate N-acetyltransferase/amino-acid N-acetyltransferase